jgi:hypothetical protein
VFDTLASLLNRDRSRRLENEMQVRHLLGCSAEQTRLRGDDPMTNTEALESTGMSRSRLLLASLLTVGIAAGSAFDVVRDSEHWPFSQYPMFSTIDRSHEHRTLRLFGVVQGSGEEMPLTDFEYLYPFDQCRVSTAMGRLNGDTATKGRVPAALADVYARYERRRAAGRHGGPPLQSVRLYRLRWELDADARNALHPDARELVLDHRPAR